MLTKGKEEETKRHVVTMRMSDTARSRINEAARANGRSVSQEIESRLELSFQEERIIGGSGTTLLTKLIASSIALVEMETDHSWTEDRMTWVAVNAAVQRILTWFQPSLDYDIWDKYRDSALMPFLEAVHRVQERADRLKGLEEAYPPALMRMPEGVRAEYDKAAEEYPAALAEAKRRAKLVFEGPMKEQAERNKEGVALGRQIAADRKRKAGGNFVVGGIMRMYVASGAFEPLPGLRDVADIEDEELMACIRKLAGVPPEDPDMSVFHMSRTYEDFQKLRVKARREAAAKEADADN